MFRISRSAICISRSMQLHQSKMKITNCDATPFRLEQAFSGGRKIGAGQFGEVREHPHFHGKVLKRFFKENENVSKLEHQGFVKYYGDYSAELLKDPDTRSVYLNMKLIHGETLSSLCEKKKKIPYLKEHLTKLVERLIEKGIYHSDLTANNIIFNGYELCPIDIVDRSEQTNKTKEEMSIEYENSIHTIYSRFCNNDKDSENISFFSMLSKIF